MTDSVLTTAAEDYEAAYLAKEEAEQALKDAKAALEDAQGALIDAMIDSDLTQIKYGRMSYSIKNVTRYNKAAGADEELFAVLRDNGLGDIIKETVNAQTLSATIGELVAETGSVPEDFSNCITTFEQTSISRRKA